MSESPAAKLPLLRPRRAVVSSLALASLAVTACSPPEGAGGSGSHAPPLPEAAFRELASPAGEGSGEPYLARGRDGVWMSWLEPAAAPTAGEGAHLFRLAHLTPEGWSAPSTIAESQRFFVNWADVPSVAALPDGTLLAHWLQRGGSATYDYGVRVARSSDGGATWSAPWTPHEDGTPTEHGFLSFVATPRGGAALVWLDGRETSTGGAMTLRARTVRDDGTRGPDVLVDGRICDCCQTDAALGAAGPVVVYRDRSPGEVRDVYVTRLVDGVWEEGRPVHADGWVIRACPVNGPAVAARDSSVWAAWFSAPGGVAQVKAAYSSDAGATFGPPVRLDAGSPGGRVDVALMGDGGALVVWLERVSGPDGGSTAEIRARRVAPGGFVGAPRTLVRSSDARASGFPRLARAADGTMVIAWTDVLGGGQRVRVARFDPSALPEPGA